MPFALRTIVPFAVLALTHAVPVPAAAQDFDLKFDPGPVDACLATAAANSRQGCVGLAAQACIAATADGGTTAGMMSCFNLENSYWQEHYSKSYQTLATFAEQGDRQTGATGEAAQNYRLAVARDSWLAYREALCGYHGAVMAGGSIVGLVYSDCHLQETARFALELMRLAELGPM